MLLVQQNESISLFLLFVSFVNQLITQLVQKRTCPMCCLYHPSAAMKRHKQFHSSKYLKQQKAIIVNREKQVQVIDVNDSESGEESEDDNIPQNKTNIIPGAPLIENIFDFLASGFMEL